MKIRLYLLLLPAIIAALVLAAPACSSGSCQGASSKMCDKACACGSDCIVNGVKFSSSAACSLALGAQCDPTKHDVDWAACSAALDTAQCIGGTKSDPDAGAADGGESDGGAAQSGAQLAVPEACSAVSGGGGAGSGSSGSSGSTSGSAM